MGGTRVEGHHVGGARVEGSCGRDQGRWVIMWEGPGWR